MIRVEVEIEGVTPLLQHRFGESAEVGGAENTRRVHVDRGTPRDEAEAVCYRGKDGKLYHPSAAILRLLREAGGSHKQKGSRKSLKWIVPAGVRPLSDTIELYERSGKKVTRASTFEVDSRPVTIPATKGRIMRHRPRLDSWVARFELTVNEKVMDAKTVQMLLTEGGQQIGIGDYRPERGGPFGTFRVTRWKESK